MAVWHKPTEIRLTVAEVEKERERVAGMISACFVFYFISFVFFLLLFGVYEWEKKYCMGDGITMENCIFIFNFVLSNSAVINVRAWKMTYYYGLVRIIWWENTTQFSAVYFYTIHIENTNTIHVFQARLFHTQFNTDSILIDRKNICVWWNSLKIFRSIFTLARPEDIKFNSALLSWAFNEAHNS